MLRRLIRGHMLRVQYGPRGQVQGFKCDGAEVRANNQKTVHVYRA